MMTTALLALAAVLLDWYWGEPRHFHPLVGFGWLADRIEQWLNRHAGQTPRARRLRGVVAVLLLALPSSVLAAALAGLPLAGILISLLVLYLAIGQKSLHEHARDVARALENNDSDEARRLAGRMVSRDQATLDAAVATTESVLENGNDGVFGALFWFAVAGAPGALLYRSVNTLDAMWGHRNDRFRDFGWAAARLDDVLNYLPARLTALTYALVAFASPPPPAQAHRDTVFTIIRRSLDCWRTQAPNWDSPNAGPVMAAGAGALGISLGGPARYRGDWKCRAALGSGPPPAPGDIERALTLVRHGVCLWLGVLVILGRLA